MSVENLKEYAHRCATDPDLRAVAKTIGMTDIEEHMRHAGSLGLDWTSADLVAFRKEVIDGKSDDLADLTEEELEQIAGGVLSVTGAALVAITVGGSAVAAGAATAAVVGGAVAGTTAASGQGGW